MRERAPSLFRQGPPAWARMLALSVTAIVLMTVDAHWNSFEVVRQYAAVAVHPFQTLMRAPRDVALTLAGWLDTAERISAENEAAQRQRIELAQLSTHALQLAEENRQLRRLLGVVEQRGAEPTILVELLYETRDPFETRLIINRGRHAGVLPGMPLIDENGLVGQVVRASPLNAEVALLTDRVVSVPVQVLRNGLRAIAFASATPGKVELRHLPADADLQPGDLLVTSGLGGWFPAGLAVARVEAVSPDGESGYGRVLAQPLAGLGRYRHFLVLQTEAAAVADEEALSDAPDDAPEALPAPETP